MAYRMAQLPSSPVVQQFKLLRQTWFKETLAKMADIAGYFVGKRRLPAHIHLNAIDERVNTQVVEPNESQRGFFVVDLLGGSHFLSSPLPGGNSTPVRTSSARRCECLYK